MVKVKDIHDNPDGFYKNELWVSESGTIRIRENIDGDEVDVSFYLKNKKDVEKIIKELEQYKEKL